MYRYSLVIKRKDRNNMAKDYNKLAADIIEP